MKVFLQTLDVKNNYWGCSVRNILELGEIRNQGAIWSVAVVPAETMRVEGSTAYWRGFEKQRKAGMDLQKEF